MKINRHILKINTKYNPFSSMGYIDKENLNYTIGDSDVQEDNVFENTAPRYIKILCELVSVQDFNRSIVVSSKYKPVVGEDSENTMNFSLYDGSKLNMKSFVSAIDIKFNEILEVSKEDWNIILRSKDILYTKKFIVENVSRVIDELKLDSRLEPDYYNYYISDCYGFGGVYHKGISVSDIEQYFYYVGTGLQSEEYIDKISSRKLLDSSYAALARNISIEDITSLEDDINMGKVVINFDDDSVYDSIRIQKNTIISDKCIVTFKRR